MKRKIQYILLSIIACILLTGCQNVEEPMNTVPSVKTDKVMFIGMTRARLSGNVSSKSNCKFLLSTQEDLSDAVSPVSVRHRLRVCIDVRRTREMEEGRMPKVRHTANAYRPRS